MQNKQKSRILHYPIPKPPKPLFNAFHIELATIE